MTAEKEAAADALSEVELPEGSKEMVVLPLRGEQGLAVKLIATVAVVYALDWAQSFFISLLLGVLFAYTLNPLVIWLERCRVPRVIGAGLIMAVVLAALGTGAYALRGQVQAILDQMPAAIGKLSTGLTRLRDGQPSTMQKVQGAATALEKATDQVAGVPSLPRQASTRLVTPASGFKLGNFVWAGSMGAAGALSQAAMVMFLTLFLLLSGDTFKRRLVRLAGPTIAKQRVTVNMLDDVNESIQRYMLMLLATNVLVGLLTWVALRVVGLQNASAWALAAGLLHVIPYLGPAITAGAIGMAAFMQFDALSTALGVVGVSVAIATVVGTFVTTWMAGRIAGMNTAAVFVSLLFWAWLWGVWGMLLSIPITVIMKVIARHVEQFQSVAVLLAD